jgi:hypothetical protein
MKHSVRPAWRVPPRPSSAAEPKTEKSGGGLLLAVLDELTVDELTAGERGYDPYDTVATGANTKDIWRSKHKRA